MNKEIDEKDIKELIGSPIRDYYRFIHKQVENYTTEENWKKCHACDIDLMEIRNEKIIAFTDVKSELDTIRWTEEKAYPELTKIAPVFIIILDENFQSFEVYSYPDKKYHHKFETRKDYFKNFIENIENVVINLNDPSKTWLSKTSMSTDKLRDFFKKILDKNEISQKEAQDRKLWWAMLYKWENGGWWVDHKYGGVS